MVTINKLFGDYRTIHQAAEHMYELISSMHIKIGQIGYVYDNENRDGFRLITTTSDWHTNVIMNIIVKDIFMIIRLVPEELYYGYHNECKKADCEHTFGMDYIKYSAYTFQIIDPKFTIKKEDIYKDWRHYKNSSMLKEIPEIDDLYQFYTANRTKSARN